MGFGHPLELQLLHAELKTLAAANTWHQDLALSFHQNHRWSSPESAPLEFLGKAA
jgi:hypothetical protein